MTVSAEESIIRNKPFIEMAPMKRMGQPIEVAECALFLSSTRASFVQGHAMVVDGGYTIV
jgi:NAD(P)-dependent dehydrogenase (short-subunit alcohol dehydrogenase family)